MQQLYRQLEAAFTREGVITPATGTDVALFFDAIKDALEWNPVAYEWFGHEIKYIPDTAYHGVRTGVFLLDAQQWLPWLANSQPPGTLELLALHDVGKIFSNGDVLNYEGALDSVSKEKLCIDHLTNGYGITRPMGFELAQIILRHHEVPPESLPARLRVPDYHWDAVGRLLMLTDSFDAGGSDRVYSKGVSRGALEEDLASIFPDYENIVTHLLGRYTLPNDTIAPRPTPAYIIVLEQPMLNQRLH